MTTDVKHLVNFPDLDHNFYDISNIVKFNLNVSPRSTLMQMTRIFCLKMRELLFCSILFALYFF